MSVGVPEFKWDDPRIDLRRTLPIKFGDGHQAEFVRLMVNDAHFVFAIRVRFATNRFKQASWWSTSQDPNRNGELDAAIFRLKTAWKRELMKRKKHA